MLSVEFYYLHSFSSTLPKRLFHNQGDVVFVFNFHPTKSFDGYFVPVATEGKYKVILSSDDGIFGGQSRVDTEYVYETMKTEHDWIGFKCYLPSRSSFVLKKID